MKKTNGLNSHALITSTDSVSSLKCKPKYTKRQWLILFIFLAINLCAGMCYSIPAPFFPREAEMRGVPPSVYGFIFGCFELVNFLVCPILGKYIHVIGVKFMINAGNFTLAICTILFGFVDKMYDRTTFVTFSFLIRMIAAIGQSGFLTGCYAVTAEEFQDRIATSFSSLESAFAVGMIIGPSVGAFLVKAGGFMCPFLAVGVTLCFFSIIVVFSLPSIEIHEHHPSSILKFLIIPSVSIAAFSSLATSFSNAYLLALLEPHLRQFHLTIVATGIVMVVNGISYAFSATFWGYACDKHLNTKLLCGFGAIFGLISFILLGPAPFIPIDQKLWIVIVALAFHGIGTSGEYVIGFLQLIQDATANNYPENIETYAMVSGLWLSGFSFGSFIGPSISGILNDVIGFRGASMVVVAIHAILAILCFGYYLIVKCKSKSHKNSVSDKSEKSSLRNGFLITTSLSEEVPLKTLAVNQQLRN